MKKPVAKQQQTKLLQRSSALALSVALAATVAIPSHAEIEEIIITAQKREQSLQDAPIAVQVLGAEQLDEMGLDGFDDYALMIPSVSFLGIGPGRAQIYMRGIADGGDGNPSGANPSVAVYLDEQPVTSIGRNLDVHVYDVARIEALPGPQGTLYGASSQAGTLRIITNQPDMDGFSAQIDLGTNVVNEGDVGHSAEGFVNFPVSDRAAIRLVGWYQKDAGYIDNVAATKTFTRNGQVVDNAPFVEEDFNEATNSGLRAALKVDLNDSWTADLKYMYQNQEREGIWDHDPEDVGDLQVERFFNDEGQDEFEQFGLTIKGSIRDYDLVYAGSYLDRDAQYDIDYSEYAEYSGYIDYYTCDYTWPVVVFSNCNDPRIQYESDSEYKRTSHELRLQSPQDQEIRFIVGLFYENDEHAYFRDWRIPGIKAGFSADQNAFALAGGLSWSPDTYFVTDQVREEEETAIFGEVSVDLMDNLTATFGARYFDHESTLTGFVGTVFSSAPLVDLNTSKKDHVLKANLTYDLNDDAMVYITWSEGYRPGGINRIATTNIPQVYEPDILTNYEIGWKTVLADNTLRFNGSAFFMTWDEIQFTRFEPSESFLGLTSNAESGEIKGVEMDVMWQPNDQWSISGAMSALQAELADPFVRKVGDPSATIPTGTPFPGVPDFKANLTARRDFSMGDYDMFAQATGIVVSSSINDFVAQENQDGYSILNLSAGVVEDEWGLTVYVNNVTDERAELFRNSFDWDARITTNRPRTVGFRFRHAL